MPVLASGCAVLRFADASGSAGTVHHGLRVCASGPGATQCPEKGNIGADATSGSRQLLLGAQIPGDVSAPATLVSDAPQPVTLSQSPGYAAELQRLQPAPRGRRWVGWMSPAVTYAAANAAQQSMLVGADLRLAARPDGSPYPFPTVTAIWVVGVRNVAGDAPADRPVACGGSLTRAFQDGPTARNAVVCLDSQLTVTSASGDLGVVATGARASGRPGGVAVLPFVLRGRNVPAGAVGPVLVAAATTLPNAAVAVTPGALAPAANGDVVARAAVGIPKGASPGAYPVTLTADLGGANGVRTGVGTLTVLRRAPGGPPARAPRRDGGPPEGPPRRERGGVRRARGHRRPDGAAGGRQARAGAGPPAEGVGDPADPPEGARAGGGHVPEPRAGDGAVSRHGQRCGEGREDRGRAAGGVAGTGRSSRAPSTGGSRGR